MNFDKVVEAIIQEAMERGEFDDLPGKGKPIDLSAYFDTPEEVRMAYSILKNAGMAPREDLCFTNHSCPAILMHIEVDFSGAEAPLA